MSEPRCPGVCSVCGEGCIDAEAQENAREYLKLLAQLAAVTRARDEATARARGFVVSRLRALASRPQNVLAMRVLVDLASELERELQQPDRGPGHHEHGHQQPAGEHQPPDLLGLAVAGQDVDHQPDQGDERGQEGDEHPQQGAYAPVADKEPG